MLTWRQQWQRRCHFCIVTDGESQSSYATLFLYHERQLFCSHLFIKIRKVVYYKPLWTSSICFWSLQWGMSPNNWWATLMYGLFKSELLFLFCFLNFETRDSWLFMNNVTFQENCGNVREEIVSFPLLVFPSSPLSLTPWTCSPHWPQLCLSPPGPDSAPWKTGPPAPLLFFCRMPFFSSWMVKDSLLMWECCIFINL